MYDNQYRNGSGNGRRNGMCRFGSGARGMGGRFGCRQGYGPGMGRNVGFQMDDRQQLQTRLEALEAETEMIRQQLKKTER